jgi:hypothetical protein
VVVSALKLIMSSVMAKTGSSSSSKSDRVFSSTVHNTPFR